MIGAFDVCLFLAVSGSHLLAMVYLGVERERPHREHLSIL